MATYSRSPRRENQPSCEDLYDEARTRPKSIRLLPTITRDAVRLVWTAAPLELTLSIALKLVNGAGLALTLLFGKSLIERLLAAGPPPQTAEILPRVVIVAALVSALGLIAAAGREIREVLSETVARHAKERIVDVAGAVELQAYENPAFHNRLARAATGQHRPIQLVDGLIGTVGALAGSSSPCSPSNPGWCRWCSPPPSRSPPACSRPGSHCSASTCG